MGRGGESRDHAGAKPAPAGETASGDKASPYFYHEGPLPPLRGKDEVIAGGLLGMLCGYYFVLLPAIIAWVAYAIGKRSALAGAALVLVLSSAFWPARKAVAPTPLTNGPLWMLFCRYFTLETVIEVPIDATSRPHVFAAFPHGIFPIGPWLSLGVAQRALPGARMCGVLASVLLRTPGLRHLYYSLGLRAADAKSIGGVLTRDRASCQIIVGGVAEMFYAADPEKERIYLRRRTGFVRLAIRHGTPLVPTFYYGASRTLDKITWRWLERLGRVFKVSFLFFYGRFAVPIPYTRPIKMVVGRPIEPPKPAGPNGQPTDEQVKELHDAFIVAIAELYERHRPTWEHRPLVIE